MDTNPNSKNGALQPLLTEEDLARALGCTGRHIRTLRAQKLIPWVRLGRLVRFSAPDVLEAVKQLTVQARTEHGKGGPR